MILAYHTIFSAYGFWLPNDPRGSWSEFVWAWELLRFGHASKTTSRESLARSAHDREMREAAKFALKHDPVVFTGIQARAVARDFAQAVTESGYQVHACAILPEHVHMVIRRHDHPIEQVVAHLKGRATQHLKREGLWLEERTPWGHDSWDVYLDSAADIVRSIAYVENNPEKEGKPRQKWSFVTPYSG